MWLQDYVGSCGVAPLLVPAVPVAFCGPGPAPPSPPPAIVPLSWTKRAVVTSDLAHVHGLDRWRILQLQGPAQAIQWCPDCGDGASAVCRQLCNTSVLCAAQVAGFDSAVFGATPADLTPLLFQWRGDAHAMGAGPPVWVSATGLSNMVRGRYAPQDAWLSLWEFLLDQLGFPAKLLPWIATVGPSYARTAPLPSDAEAQAVVRSAWWLANNSRLLVVANTPGANATRCCVGQLPCQQRQCTAAQVCPAPLAPPGVVNVSCMQEGWSSIITANGAQLPMPVFIRTDGNAEAAMALAAAATLMRASGAAGRDVRPSSGQPGAGPDGGLAAAMMEQTVGSGATATTAAGIVGSAGVAWLSTAERLLDYMFRWSTSQSFSNASQATHGIVWWNQQDAGAEGTAQWADVDYGDNAGNVLIGATAVMALGRTTSWRSRMLYALFAEVRTTGRNGLRPAAVRAPDLARRGWATYFNNLAAPSGSGPNAYTPHYGAYPSAYFAWAAAAMPAQRALFLPPALGYVAGLMASYFRGEWDWNESFSNEQARMLLPLAWLVRVNDTFLHRAWLNRVAGDLLATLQPCGALRQVFGTGREAGRCSPCAPGSNAAYGSGEGPIIFNGTEPVSDALYTVNFALAGLHEAYGATGNETSVAPRQPPHIHAHTHSPSLHFLRC